MFTFITILRGINVSGQKLIKMNDLRKCFEDLGFLNVTTYVQSGNIIFSTLRKDKCEIERTISVQIEKNFGFNIPFILLTIEVLEKIIFNNPFKTHSYKNTNYLYFTFLSSKPDLINLKLLGEKALAGEEFSLSDDIFYLYCPHGYSRTKLTNSYLEKMLKVKATTRNWKTTNQIFKIANEIIHK